MIRFASALAALIAIHSINVRAAVVDDVAAGACAAIKSRVDAVAGDTPVFLRSYDAAIGVAAPDQPALRTAAFVYDNSLAVDALLACGDKTEALRVGEALRRAIESDMRLRNVYRAGETIAERLVGRENLAMGRRSLPARNGDRQRRLGRIGDACAVRSNA